MKENRIGSHTKSRLTAHIVWVTKYRYHVLQGDIKQRCRDLLVQICDSEDVRILKGVVSKDHVHMHTLVSAEDCAFGFAETTQRAIITADTTRVSTSAKAILGATLLGDGLRCVVNWQHHRRSRPRILGASSATIKQG